LYIKIEEIGRNCYYDKQNYIPLMMEAEMVSETLGICPQLTRLVAREDFIEKYIVNMTWSLLVLSS
jgi:hypothetical protein